MEISPEILCDDVCDKALEKVYPSFLPTMLSDLSPNLQGSSNGQPLFADSFGHNANASSQLTSDESLDRSWWLSPIRGGSRTRMVQDSSGEKHWFLDSPKTFEQNANAGPQVTSDESIPPWLRPLASTSEKQNYDESSHYLSGHSTDIAPSSLLSSLSPSGWITGGSSNGQHLFLDSFEHNANASPQVTSDESLDLSWLLSPIRGDSRTVQDSSDGQHSLLDSLKTFGHNANASPQVTSDESIPPWLRPLMPSGESSQYLSGHSNPFSIFPNGPKIPAMHCGQKRQDTADNFKVGCNMLPQKCRRLPPSRRNSPPISNQSNHTGSGQWLGNYPTTEKINMPQGRAFESHKLKATYSMLSGETLTPDALASTSQPLQNGMPCEDRCETSTKRESQGKETIEGNNIHNAITVHDVVDRPTHMRAQPSLGSISTQPSSSFSSIENTKLFFDSLITLRLEVLSDPEKETSMKNVLSILADNLSLFSEKQGDQILGLLLEFPALVRNWRECFSQFQMYGQQSSSETEKIRGLVENSGKDEESLKVRYEKLENKEKELMRQLDKVQREKAEIAELRTEKSKQTKGLKEKEAHRNKEERLMRIAATKLDSLSDQWAKLQAFFI